jgi:hypothetical protein
MKILKKNNLFFFSFLFLIYLIYKIKSQTKINEDWLIKSIDSNSKLQILTSKEWVINFNVSQYSSILSVKTNSLNENVLTIESLILMNQHKNELSIKYLRDNLRCLVNSNERSIQFAKITEVLEITLMGIASWPKSLYRIKSTMKTNHKNMSEFKLAIIDSKYFKFYKDQNSKIVRKLFSDRFKILKKNKFYSN